MFDEFSFLLDSARFHPKTGRRSFYGRGPFFVFVGDDFEKFRRACLKYKRAFKVGYFSYDLRHSFERLPSSAQDDLRLPRIYFMFFDPAQVKVIDHAKGQRLCLSEKLFSNTNFHESKAEFPQIYSCKFDLPCRQAGKNSCEFVSKGPFQSSLNSNMTEDEFVQMVLRAKEYIRQGEIYQANLSQRFEARLVLSPWELYLRLRKVNPSPFAAFLQFEDLSIVSSSPERLIEVEGREVQTRPIAGTRPRGKNWREDEALREELLLNEKERAEHIMLVDLERNDLGRVCIYGSVRVDELMALEEYSHVIHIVSNVRGELRKDTDIFDIIAAIFPGGTITGCPKVRCMELIDELEPHARGIYTGSIGYIDPDGNMDLNIVIRTFVIKDGKAYIQVGAGIVADSDPKREYHETLYKAEALFQALGVRMKHGNFEITSI